jgi:hypothetical protein
MLDISSETERATLIPHAGHGVPCVTEFDRDTRAEFNARDGSVLGYKPFDFGLAPVRSRYPRTMALKVELRDRGVPAMIEVWLGDPCAGRRLGAFSIKPSRPSGETCASGEGWRTLSIPVEAPEGRHALHLRFSAAADAPKDSEIADLRFFGFIERPPCLS